MLEFDRLHKIRGTRPHKEAILPAEKA